MDVFWDERGGVNGGLDLAVLLGVCPDGGPVLVGGRTRHFAQHVVRWVLSLARLRRAVAGHVFNKRAALRAERACWVEVRGK